MRSMFVSLAPSYVVFVNNQFCVFSKSLGSHAGALKLRREVNQPTGLLKIFSPPRASQKSKPSHFPSSLYEMMSRCLEIISVDIPEASNYIVAVLDRRNSLTF